MSKKIEVKTLVTGIVMGGMVSLGTYFFLPPPQDAFACSESDIVSAINYCMDGARIRGNRISTYC